MMVTGVPAGMGSAARALSLVMWPATPIVTSPWPSDGMAFRTVAVVLGDLFDGALSFLDVGGVEPDRAGEAERAQEPAERGAGEEVATDVEEGQRPVEEVAQHDREQQDRDPDAADHVEGDHVFPLVRPPERERRAVRLRCDPRGLPGRAGSDSTDR
ncbi:MAG: hypothetical protein EON52_28525 [Actinomycetales bacterium]|nr:MAG: hypothetical protein EON52_28525 [Actinomycetales bacterium]